MAQTFLRYDPMSRGYTGNCCPQARQDLWMAFSDVLVYFAAMVVACAVPEPGIICAIAAAALVNAQARMHIADRRYEDCIRRECPGQSPTAMRRSLAPAFAVYSRRLYPRHRRLA